MVKRTVIVEQIENDIYNRVYQAGEQLPSVRELCKKYGCSHMTAFNALLDLASNGLIEGRERAGYFVLGLEQDDLSQDYIRGVEEPNIANILTHLIETESHDNIHPLGTAARMEMLLPMKQILESAKVKEQFFRNSFSAYSYAPGDIELRRQISKRLNWREIKSLPEELIITNGATEAMFLSLRALTSPGDSVIISTPCFFGTINMLEQLKLRVIEVPSITGVGVDVASIKRMLARNPEIKAGVFQVNYDNPTGDSLSESDRKELVKIFKEYGIFIVEDDTYGELSHDGDILSNLKKYDKGSEVVFSCGSFSKTLGPGFRVGWISPPTKFIEKLKRLRLGTTFSGVTVSEKLLSQYLKKKGRYEKHLVNLNATFKENVNSIRELCEEYLPEGTIISRPRGGFCLWVKFDKKLDSFLLYKNLIKKNIAISPGIIFSSKHLFPNYIRINCGVELNEKVEKSIKVIGVEAKKIIQGNN